MYDRYLAHPQAHPLSLLFKTLSIIGLITLASGCASRPLPYHFSPGEPPSWTKKELFTEGERLYVVGLSPATFEVQSDVDLAQRDAQAKLSQYFSSEVRSRVSLWTLQGSVGGEEVDVESSEVDIEVSSHIQVEQTEVMKSFRDAKTTTQYVLVSLDRERWLKQIRGRLKRLIEKNEALLNRMKAYLKDQAPLEGYRTLQGAVRLVQKSGKDLVIMRLLDKDHSYEERIDQLKHRLKQYDQTLKQESPFVLEIQAPPTPLGDRLKRQAVSNWTTFLKELGFQVQARRSPSAIRIQMKIDQSFVRRDLVGDRVDFVHAASGSLQVMEPSGLERVDLSVTLGDQTYTESDPDQQRAIERALELSKGRLLAKGRSLFRSQYVDPDEEP